MRAPLRRNPRRQAVSRASPVPAPTAGWDAASNIANMPADRAVRLDNMFPDSSECRLRNGYTEHATGIGGIVETLMEYRSPTANRLFAAGNGAIYDVTTAGAVGSAAVSGLSEDRWSHVQYSNSAGNWLIAVNGDDVGRKYDGSSWSTLAVSNGGSPSLADSSSLDYVAVFARRLFFLEKNSLRFWYLAVNEVGSPSANVFDLGPHATLGGKLVAMGSWTRDGGAGMDDLGVFLTSAGEVFVYSGLDPANANSWTRVGIFRIGPPIGTRCLYNLAGDLVVATVDGLISLSQAINLERMKTERFSLSGRIANAVTTAYATFGSLPGWQVLYYPTGSWVILNVPQSNATYHQYVMNSQTGAWCRFIGMGARCWSCLADDLYFGSEGGSVFRADNGQNDGGAGIQVVVLQAYNYFGRSANLKHFRQVRPILFSNSTLPEIEIQVSVDFQESDIPGSTTFAGTAAGVWDAGLWDSAIWGGAQERLSGWQTTNSLGEAGALRIEATLKDIELTYAGASILYEMGAPY